MMDTQLLPQFGFVAIANPAAILIALTSGVPLRLPLIENAALLCKRAILKIPVFLRAACIEAF